MVPVLCFSLLMLLFFWGLGSGSGFVARANDRPELPGVWIREESQPNAGFGGAFGGGGDINGDGFDDLALGEPGFGLGDGRRAGRVLIFFGSPLGLGSEPDQIILGSELDSRFGEGIAIVGDVNGDSFADVAIGTVSTDFDSMSIARISVHHGFIGGGGAGYYLDRAGRRN